MPRPRRDDQETLLARIAAGLSQRTSLDPWTLAELAPTAGLSPAGLIKRFGSRQGILVALSRRWIDAIPERPSGDDAVEELRRWVALRFSPGDAEGVAIGLVNLLDDLTDPALRALLAEGWGKEISYLAALLQDMPLRRLHDAGTGAYLLFDALNGAMLRSAAVPDASTADRLLDDMLEVWS